MGHEKFDQHTGDSYMKNYFFKDKEFYSTISGHISEFVHSESVGLDIGAGPGVGAMLISDLNLKTKLIGLEPSKTSSDGYKLSKKFSEENKLIEYESIKAGILDFRNLEIDGFDYILILRASHEIAESLGGKREFFEELEMVLKKLKNSGILIIAEPQYLEENPSEELIKKVQEYQLNTIGHCHVPSDYISSSEMKKQIEKFDLKLVKESILPKNELVAYLNSNGLSVEKSPCGFYIQTFQK